MLWLPNAILLAGFLLTPPRRWWLLLGATLPAHVAAQIPAGVPLPMVVCWFISNSTEALIAAVLVRRYAGQPFRLDRFSNVCAFVAAGLLAVFAASFLDAFFVALNEWGASSFGTVWRARFFANATTTLTLVPAILGLASLRPATARATSRGRIIEATSLTIALVVMSTYVFGRQLPGPDTSPALLYAPIPLLLWAALRFSPGAAAAAVFVTVMIATLSAVQGRGPFTSASAETNALQIQLLFGIVAVAQVTLAAVLEERRRALAIASRTGEQLRLAVDAAQAIAWDRDVALQPDHPAGSALLARELFRLFEARLGRVHPADRRMVSNAFARALRDDEPISVQFRVAAAAGDVRWVHGQGRLLRDAQRGRARVIGLSADITDRKLAEELAQGESRILQMIASGAPLRDILTGIALLVESETLGLACSVRLLDRDGIHARHYAAPNLPDSFARCIDALEIGPAAGSCGTAMYLRRTVSSPDIALDPLWDACRGAALRHGLRGCWSAPIVSESGDVLGSFALYFRTAREPSARELHLVSIAMHLAVIAIDRRRAELMASEQSHALAHLGRAAVLGELTGALAHELSHPLAVILSSAQTARRLLDSAPAAATVREIIDEIITAERRAAEIIEDMRTMLRRRPIALAPVDLNLIIEETLRLMRRDLTVREVRVVVRLEPQLPHVLGDRVQLQQVLLNLILNACEGMSGNAPADRILTVASRVPAAGFAEVDVTDHGTGIPEAQRNRIFDAFFTTKPNGLGLGLSICQSIARSHGGRLHALNADGGGATLRFTLPAAQPGLEDGAAPRDDALQ